MTARIRTHISNSQILSKASLRDTAKSRVGAADSVPSSVICYLSRGLAIKEETEIRKYEPSYAIFAPSKFRALCRQLGFTPKTVGDSVPANSASKV